MENECGGFLYYSGGIHRRLVLVTINGYRTGPCLVAYSEHT